MNSYDQKHKIYDFLANKNTRMYFFNVLSRSVCPGNARMVIQ